MEEEQLTPGGIAVGLSFNPSGDEIVNQIKKNCANVFDLVEISVPADDGTIENARKRKMRDSALEAIITAQMWAVKVVTLKHVK
jgi:hypothetical protein